MGEAADDADDSHDEGGEKEPARALAGKEGGQERPFLAGRGNDVAFRVQPAEQLHERQAGDGTDAGAEAAAQVAGDVDGAAVRVAVGGQSAHAVVGDRHEGVEQFKHEVDDDGQHDFQRVGHVELREHQDDGDGPRNGAPERERAALFPVLERVVDRPVADHRVVYGIPYGADGDDHAGVHDVDADDVGQKQ